MNVIDNAINLIVLTLKAVVLSLGHNWYVLLFAILLAVIIKTYVNSEKLSQLLFRKKKVSIFASVLFGAFTPLCACGTTAVIIGMLTTTLPWGPIMAFLTSSPLMSPDGFVMLTGVIGIKFAIALTVASVVIGIASGFITNIIESKTDFLKNQSRFVDNKQTAGCSCHSVVSDCTCGSTTPEVESCCKPAISNEHIATLEPSSEYNPISVTVNDCGCETAAASSACSCSKAHETPRNHFVNLENTTQYCCVPEEPAIKKWANKYKLPELWHTIVDLGLKQILLYYSIFVAVGFLINYFVPTSIITVLFGANSVYAVPLASLIGLPLYITTESGIPIIQSMLSSGASEGAMLAFMITGSATSAWVIAGLATFLKKRALALYIAFVLLGGIISGYLLDLFGLIF